MDSAAIRAAIEEFLARSRQPALLEPGEEQLPLTVDNFALEFRSGWLTLQAWDERRNIVRRIVSVAGQRPGRLELIIERFGKRQGQMFLIDLSRANRTLTERRGARLVFREEFRHFLWRRFPDWKIVEVSAEANLEESLSPTYPRALLRKGGVGIAALAAPPDAEASSGALTFGLIWLDYLRRRERRLSIEGLVLFLAQGQERPASLRIPFLEPSLAQISVYLYSYQGQEQWLDPCDYGNVDTHLEACRTACPDRSARVEGWLARLGRLPEVETIVAHDGTAVLRVRGLPFARAARDQLRFGITVRTEAAEQNLGEIEQLAAEIARRRSPWADDRENALYRLYPEAWLESEVRAHLEEIEATLQRAPVYGQVPAVSAGNRGIIDLLAVDRSGRLAVLELKASEDIHLPLQALDYWMRVKWHLDRGEFASLGYFPGIALRREPPRLLLIAPALGFHPKTETILRYFSSGLEVERIGLGVEWRKGPEVMFRARGAEGPA